MIYNLNITCGISRLTTFRRYFNCVLISTLTFNIYNQDISRDLHNQMILLVLDCTACPLTEQLIDGFISNLIR